MVASVAGLPLAAGFVRVSTGSQEEASQVKVLTVAAAERGIIIVKWFKLHGYSASAGEQEPAIREAIADIERGDYSTIMVTESSRLDRRKPKQQKATLLAIALVGGEVVSVTEPEFGKDDTLSEDILTTIAQHMNHEKSKTVKNSTYRGIMMIRDNKAHHGALPAFWETKGEHYAKQAYCVNPAAVADIYERVAAGESLASIGRAHDIYPASVKHIIRFAANHTGVEECSYTHEGVMETWAHRVTPVVESPLWWRANKVLEVNITNDRANKGGRPVAQPANWISGVLDCPECGGKLYLNAGRTPAGNPRTPKLRCGGYGKKRLSCGRFKGIDAQPVIDDLTAMFASDTTDILAFQRIAGNAHELEALKASLPKLQSQLSVITDRATRRETLNQIEELEDRIESFEIIPDDFDYAPARQTVAGMWSGDDAVKRNMVKAVKNSWGLALARHEGQWGIKSGTDLRDMSETGGIVDLGNGLCFRR